MNASVDAVGAMHSSNMLFHWLSFGHSAWLVSLSSLADVRRDRSSFTYHRQALLRTIGQFPANTSTQKPPSSQLTAPIPSSQFQTAGSPAHPHPCPPDSVLNF